MYFYGYFETDVLRMCLQKKRPENAFLTQIVNYCKIVQKNKL